MPTNARQKGGATPNAFGLFKSCVRDLLEIQTIAEERNRMEAVRRKKKFARGSP